MTGIQFWTISYMEVVYQMEAMEVQSFFVFCLLFGVALGVMIGSSLADCLGGYQGKGMKNALSLSLAFSTVTLICCLVMSSVPERHMF